MKLSDEVRTGVVSDRVEIADGIAQIEKERDALRDTNDMFISWMKRHPDAVDFNRQIWDAICEDYPYLRERMKL